MKCVVCNGRKGKRFCPAKNGLICPQCCGEKRVLEIACPESCPYLKAGRTHEARQENSRHLWTADAVKLQARARLFDRFETHIARLEYLIAQQRHRIRDLRDVEVASALELLIATYRTEERGVLYEQTASDLRVEGLRRELRDAARTMRDPQEPHGERLRLSDLLACLELVRDVTASHIESGDSPSSYVDFLARMVPRESSAGTTGSLIIPG